MPTASSLLPSHLPPSLQVALNQLCLAPLTISIAFGWTLALQQRLGELPSKLRADFVPTMLNGWKFWVPAATLNFTMVPLSYQVGGQLGGSGKDSVTRAGPWEAAQPVGADNGASVVLPALGSC